MIYPKQHKTLRGLKQSFVDKHQMIKGTLMQI